MVAQVAREKRKVVKVRKITLALQVLRRCKGEKVEAVDLQRPNIQKLLADARSSRSILLALYGPPRTRSSMAFGNPNAYYAFVIPDEIVFKAVQAQAERTQRNELLEFWNISDSVNLSLYPESEIKLF